MQALPFDVLTRTIQFWYSIAPFCICCVFPALPPHTIRFCELCPLGYRLALYALHGYLGPFYSGASPMSCSHSSRHLFGLGGSHYTTPLGGLAFILKTVWEGKSGDWWAEALSRPLLFVKDVVLVRYIYASGRPGFT